MIGLLMLAVCMQQAASVRFASSPLMTKLLTNYDNTQRPHHLGKPERLRVGIYIEALLDVDQKKKTYTVDGIFRIYWKDPRLAFPGSSNEDKIHLNNPHSGDFKIWTPDIYIHQGIKVSMAGDESALLMISQDGSVFWSRRMTAELHCQGFNFGQLPYDVQKCGIMISDYTYSEEEMVLEWADPNNLASGQMEVEEWTANFTSTKTLVKQYPMGTGNMSCIAACLQFTRSSQQFARTMRVAFLLVVASYTGFWIPAAAAPARVALAFLCFLMVLSNMQAVEGKLPPLMLTRHVWLLNFLAGCMLLCFAALLEYGLVSVGLADAARKKAAAEADKDPERLGVRPEPWFNLSKLSDLDEIFIYAFPIAFIVFMAFIFAALPRYAHLDDCVI